MAWTLTEEEIKAMLSASPERRYAYFIRRVCETRKIWCLYNGGWATLGDGAEQYMPFWPHPAFAERFRTGTWRSYQVKEIDLSTFIERWIPGMTKDQIGPAIFPVSKGSSATTCLEDLEENLRCELTNPSPTDSGERP